jgi:large subunit ribosomal protein L29
MRAVDLRQETVEDLRNREVELSEQLMALRLQKVTGQLEKPSKIKLVKRDMARVLTVLRERELAGEAGGENES